MLTIFAFNVTNKGFQVMLSLVSKTFWHTSLKGILEDFFLYLVKQILYKLSLY